MKIQGPAIDQLQMNVITVKQLQHFPCTKHLHAAKEQGVTYVSLVEMFANGIKMESSDQDSFWETIKGSGRNPSNEDQWLNSQSQNDQGRFSPIKILDPVRKRFYWPYVSDYPLEE